jgi:hypothetical protein
MPLLQEGYNILGTYEVERFLGEGAFAEVYRVRHRFLGLCRGLAVAPPTPCPPANRVRRPPADAVQVGACIEFVPIGR